MFQRHASASSRDSTPRIQSEGCLLTPRSPNSNNGESDIPLPNPSHALVLCGRVVGLAIISALVLVLVLWQAVPMALAQIASSAIERPAHAQAVTTSRVDRAYSTGSPLANSVACIGLTVADMDRSIAFFHDVLSFDKMSDIEVAGDSFEHLEGLFGLRMRIVTMKLGDECIELTEYLAPTFGGGGRPYPADSRSNDRWFQHIAIITNDMDRAYAWLRQNRVRHASSGPQLLPSWNKNAGGISAFYFHDPDGHVLEVLQFPPDKGNPKWRERAASSSSDRLFLGIDHTAIVVADTDQSLRFYRDVLGMQVAGTSENYGAEQEHLNNVFGARLRITSLHPAAPNSNGPSIEFLEYLAPRDGRPYPTDARSNDLLCWQTTIVTDDLQRATAAMTAQHATWISPGAVALPGGEGNDQLGFRAAALLRDPDGHVIRLIER